MRAKISRGLTAAHSVRPDAEPLAGARTEAVEQHVGLGREVEQHLRLLLHVQVDDALAAVRQVDVLGGHFQAAGPAHPHHVGAQVGEHHRRMRARADATEFDHLHPRQGSRVGHGCNVTQQANIVTYADRRARSHTLGASVSQESPPDQPRVQ